MKDNLLKNERTIILPASPFPSISWWIAALQSRNVIINGCEAYKKMSYGNRYYLADKKGRSLLSIPLEKGRSQHIPIKEVRISYAENWCKVHSRTLQTLLGNSPFFEYIDYQILAHFQNDEISLWKFNIATIRWVNQFLGNPISFTFLETNVQHPPDAIDMSHIITPKVVNTTPVYYQVFKEESGFVKDCSILDLICCEGKNALSVLKNTLS